MVVVENVLTAERAAHGKRVGAGEFDDVPAGFLAPAAAADDHHRAGRGPEQGAQLRHVAIARMGMGGFIAPGVGDVAHLGQHVLGQHHRHRTGSARGRGTKRPRHQFRDAPGLVDAHHPLGERRIHEAVIDFLEGFTLGLMARHVTDQQDHRRRVLERGMDPDAGVAGPRTAGDDADAGLAGQLAIGLGHVGGAGFLAAGDQADFVLDVIERVEEREITFAGDGKDGVGAVNPERIDEDAPTGPGIGIIIRHTFLRPCDRPFPFHLRRAPIYLPRAKVSRPAGRDTRCPHAMPSRHDQSSLDYGGVLVDG